MSTDASQPAPTAEPTNEAPLDAAASTAAPAASVTRTGSMSKMRSHRGNIPTLPQTKLCPLCPAKFTRTTHLNRHMKTHSNERMYECERCHAQFTRSDLLTRHKRTCCESSVNRSRRKSCKSCAESKVRCDLEQPCAKCKARGRECVYTSADRRGNKAPADAEGASSGSSSSQDSPEASGSGQGAASTKTSPIADFAMPATLLDNLAASMTSFGTLDGLSLPASASQTAASSSGALALAGSSNTALATTDGTSEDERAYSDVFSSTQMYDGLFTDLFTSSFEKHPSIPGQHFMQDPTMLLTDRMESTMLDPEMFDIITQTTSGPTQLGIYSLPATMGATPDPMEHIPETEIMESASTGDHGLTMGGMPSISEYYSYITSFLTIFLQHLPILHQSTFLKEPRHLLLVKASKACGALYAKTPGSKKFIQQILASTRDEIIAELSHATEFDVMTQLTLASCLIQTIGMYHKDPEQRAKSNVYHGMIVMMLRMNGFIEQTREWKHDPIDFTDPRSVETAWRKWVKYETAKRAIWISYCHDCSHVIYFNLQPTFHNEHFTLGLPAEDALWAASSAEEWGVVLQQPSKYGTVESRLHGQYIKTMYNFLVQDNPSNEPRDFNVSPFAHYLMIHAVLRKLFELYLRDRLPFQQAATGSDVQRPKLNPHYVDKVRVFHVQILLHCWLQSWLSSPESPRDIPESQQRYSFNALPLYWLAQVGLVAYQEGLPPFDADGVYITSHEAKFHLMKKWESHIRKFLEDGSQTTTKFWDEVMKIRTDTWTAESGFEYPHLLGFFYN